MKSRTVLALFLLVIPDSGCGPSEEGGAREVPTTTTPESKSAADPHAASRPPRAIATH